MSQTKKMVKGIHLAQLHVAQCVCDSHFYRWVIPLTLTSKRMPLNIVFTLQMFWHCLNKSKNCIFHIPCHWTSDFKHQTGVTKVTMECIMFSTLKSITSALQKAKDDKSSISDSYYVRVIWCTRDSQAAYYTLHWTSLNSLRKVLWW